ncbi:hypothetical protein [Streptomyces chartreusis]
MRKIRILALPLALSAVLLVGGQGGASTMPASGDDIGGSATAVQKRV